jgi:hypothetical protein
MDKEIAIIALQKAVEKRKRRNELAKKMRERRGEELKEKNKEYVRIHREKKKRELEEAMSVIKKDVLPKELPIKKDLIRIEKDKGELISRVDRTGVKGVTEKTAINYMNKISVIHKIISKNELDKETLKRILLGNEETDDEKKILNNMEYMNNIDELIRIIEDKYDNLQSRKAYISSYLTLISYLPKTKKEGYEKIREKFEEINNAIYGIRGENERADNEEMIDSFEEEDILKNMEGLKMEEEIIYIFYTLQPPRRSEDVYLITIKNNSENLDNNTNYIIVDSNNNPEELIYNKYKTNKIYGRQIITLTNKILKNKIREYIYINNLKEGDKLFRKFSSPQSFGVAIKRIFSKIYDKKITLNNIRHSYITWEMREMRSVNYLSNLAMMMGHSAEEQQLYKRVK